MNSKNNLVCALLPLHWGMKMEVWRRASHPPLSSVWSRLKQHLSDDNLEKILPLSFDMLLCRDLEDANYTGLFFSNLHHAPSPTQRVFIFGLSQTEDNEQACKCWIAIVWALHKWWTEALSGCNEWWMIIFLFYFSVPSSKTESVFCAVRDDAFEL